MATNNPGSATISGIAIIENLRCPSTGYRLCEAHLWSHSSDEKRISGRPVTILLKHYVVRGSDVDPEEFEYLLDKPGWIGVFNIKANVCTLSLSFYIFKCCYRLQNVKTSLSTSVKVLRLKSMTCAPTLSLYVLFFSCRTLVIPVSYMIWPLLTPSFSSDFFSLDHPNPVNQTSPQKEDISRCPFSRCPRHLGSCCSSQS